LLRRKTKNLFLLSEFPQSSAKMFILSLIHDEIIS
jgi:hypothetical protein